MQEISDIVNTLEIASGRIDDATRDLVDIEDNENRIEEQRSLYAMIIRDILGDDAELFDEDYPEELLRLIRETNRIAPSNLLIAFAYGYKSAVDERGYFFYVRKLREAITQQEREDASDKDLTNPS